MDTQPEGVARKQRLHVQSTAQPQRRGFRIRPGDGAVVAIEEIHPDLDVAQGLFVCVDKAAGPGSLPCGVRYHFIADCGDGRVCFDTCERANLPFLIEG